MRRYFIALAVGLLVSSSVRAEGPVAVAPQPGEPLRFNRDIRPILSDNCFYCHGSDAEHRKAKLRLDTLEGLLEKRDDGPPVVPGRPEASQLYARLVTDDADELMPPPSSHKKLTPQQKQIVRQWIEQGAQWEPHWSFAPVRRPNLPTVKNAGWVRNPIDAFVLAELEAKGLQPAPEADRRTLARRAAFDLTGLPPTPEDLAAFLNDTAPDAYERYIDKLIASPAWGEHRARYWLDAARYGDTHGIHNDNYREMWPYRDHVIAAFNRNQPFDQFIVEALAGDLLPNRTLDQQIASGFQRCNITTSEGGSIADEVLAVYAKDRVETFGAVFLGLTTGCASCHDHKFDPVSMRDFYSLAAFFRNNTQGAMDGNRPDTPPIIVVPNMADRPMWDELSRRQAELTARRDARKAGVGKAFDAWLKSGEHKKLTDPINPADHYLTAAFDEGDACAVVHHGGQSTPLALPAGISWADGRTKDEKSIKFADKASLDLGKDLGDFDLDQPFSLGAWVLVPPDEGGFVVASRIDPNAKGQSPGWALSIETRVPSFRMFAKGGGKIEVRGNSSSRPASGKWTHLFITYDGSRHPSGVTMYVNGEPQTADYAADSKPLAASIRTAASLRLGTDGKRYLTNGAISEFRMYRREVQSDEVAVLSKWPTIRKAVARADGKLSPAERNDLQQLYLSRFDPEYSGIIGTLADVERGQQEIRKRSAVTHVMNEKPGEAKAKVLFRGMYDQPRDEVVAATPAALHPWPEQYPRNRLGLAWWTIDPKNPLPARVTVNRFWQELFGSGLVRTSEDFGIMGENPSHPELLDWLAAEFAEGARASSPASADATAKAGGDARAPWDVKRFYKLLMTSNTYRQAAIATPLKLKVDPLNRLLSRGPRFRMDAEVLRDMALATSGLLNRTIGGPSVKPYQPPGVWEAVAMFSSNTRFYKPDTGDKLYRRSMYWFWKRSAPPAPMELLNAPTREVCTVRRERTNTPLQALVTMNDPQWVEASRMLAEKAMKEAGSDTFDARLDYITLRVLARPMDADERAICRSAWDDFQKAYAGDAEAAKKLISTGEAKRDETLNPAAHAAWTMLTSQILNLDEALNK
jgi:cytochrome c553